MSRQMGGVRLYSHSGLSRVESEGKQRTYWPASHISKPSDMETEWVALDLRMPNPKSADPRDGIFVISCSLTTFDNKPITKR